MKSVFAGGRCGVHGHLDRAGRSGAAVRGRRSRSSRRAWSARRTWSAARWSWTTGWPYYVPRSGSEDDELATQADADHVPGPARPPPAGGHTRMAAAVVRGVLEREGSRLVCRVTSLEVKPGDLERLKSAVDQLGPQDYADPRGLGAVGRAPRARSSEDERPDATGQGPGGRGPADGRASVKRVAVDAPEEWLAMAQRGAAAEGARARALGAGPPGVPGPPGRGRRRPPRCEALIGRDRGVLPGRRRRSGRRHGRAWHAGRPRMPTTRPRPIARRPPEIRKALDRRLWADAAARLLELEPIPDLAAAIARSEQAAEPPAGEARAAGSTAGEGARRRPPRARHPAAGRGQGAWPKPTATDCDGPRRPRRSCANGWRSSGRGSATPTPRGGWPWPSSTKTCSRTASRPSSCCVKLGRSTRPPGETAEAFRNRGFRKAKDEWVEVERRRGAPAVGRRAECRPVRPRRPPRASSA